LWNETHANITVTEGVFHVLLGSATAFPADLFTTAGERYLEIRVNSETLDPRSRITSVAYSLRADQADNVANNAITVNQIQDGAVTLSKIRTSGATDNQVPTYTTANGLEWADPPSGGTPGANTITTGMIINGEVQTDDIGDDAVTVAKIGHGSASGQVLSYDGANVGWSAPASSPWSVNGSDVYRISGEVGIGIAAPLYPLDISTSGIMNGIRIDHNGYASSVARGLYIDIDNDANSTYNMYGTYATVTNNNASSTANNYGLYGYASGSSGGPKYGVYGAAAGNGLTYAGYFNGDVNIGGDLSLTGDVSTDLNVTGTVTADNLAYSTARTHYYSLPSEAFTSTSTYYNTGGNGGAYVGVAYGTLTAPVNLPDGATVTRFTVYFNDTSSLDMPVWLLRNLFDSGYSTMATVTSSGTSGYYNLSDATIAFPTIDNSSYGYAIYISTSNWSSTLMIMGAVITYTLDEAQ